MCGLVLIFLSPSSGLFANLFNLFGAQFPNLMAKATAFKHVYVWSPEYGHPVWHNEGDSLQLMPTITEYWTPMAGTAEYRSEEYVKLANEKLYYERMEKDELRITFMRHLVPNFYVFLGVYRMDTEHSTCERFVWKRVCDTCDLGLLPQLQQLRKIK